MPRVLFLTLALLALGAPLRSQETDRAKEYKVKAVLLANFAKFTRWPTTAFEKADSPLVFAVYRKNPFGGALKALAGRRVGKRTIVVKMVRTPAEARTCHVLFVSPLTTAERTKLFKGLGRAPVLTVGEKQGFAAYGGVMRFRVVSGKIRFDINTKSAERAGLRLHPKLLRSGRIVKDRAPPR